MHKAQFLQLSLLQKRTADGDRKIVSNLTLRRAAVQITGKCATSAQSVVIFDHFAVGLLQNSGGQMFSPSAFFFLEVKP